MHLRINKDRLQEWLSSISNAVDRKNHINILANFKFDAKKDQLTLTGSDLELELVCKAPLKDGECVVEGETTIPARKLLDICKALSPNSIIDIQINDKGQCIVKSAQSRFVIGTLAAEDYPLLKARAHDSEFKDQVSVTVAESELKRIIDRTSFAMAVNDVRFYLTGTLLEIENSIVRAVCTDGHRLALCEACAVSNLENMRQAILPRKTISELQKLCTSPDQHISLFIGRELISASVQRKKDDQEYTIEITSKLIDATYPDYRRIIPKSNDKVAVIDTSEFKQAASRVAILSSEKLKAVILTIEDSNMSLRANNPDQDEATEDLEITYDNDDIEIAFNVQYLIEALNAISADKVELKMLNETQATVLVNPQDPSQLYIVMPVKH